MTGATAGFRERIGKALNGHALTTGLSVASGNTCQCGYWTGSESDGGQRPLPWGRDRLDVHRADVLIEAGLGDVAGLLAAIDRVLNLTSSIGPEARRILREATGLETSTE